MSKSSVDRSAASLVLWLACALLSGIAMGVGEPTAAAIFIVASFYFGRDAFTP